MSLKKKTISGLLWTFSQQAGVQGVNFVVQIFLARILLPEAFGLIAMLQIFIAISNSLVDGGMTSSLIREKKIDNRDYSSVFFINITVSFCIYWILFFTSPFIAEFYNQPELTSIIRVYSIIIIIQSLNAIQTTKLTKEMNFKLQMYMQIPSVIAAGIIGIVLAKNMFGVWSLVWMQLIGAFLFTAQHWIFSKWRPQFIFDSKRLKHHFNFGYKLTLSSLLSSVYSNIYRVIIGKAYSATQLGFYYQANTLSMFPVNNLNKALAKVTYPMFSSLQHNPIKLRDAYIMVGKYIFWIICPIMVFLIFFAKIIFIILLTEKWLPAVLYFQILCIATIFYPHSIYSLNILAAKGRSDLHLKVEVYKKITSIATLLLLILLIQNVIGIVIASALSMIIHFLFNSYFCGKQLDYPLYKQLIALLPPIFVSLFSGACAYYVYIKLHDINLYVLFFMISLLFFAIYLILSFMVKLIDIREIKGILKR